MLRESVSSAKMTSRGSIRCKSTLRILANVFGSNSRKVVVLRFDLFL